ncbi:MAG: hypothetical protein ACI8XU_001334 [Kiritimatiellia bacterium]|jgi:hypothetical protein
MIPADEALQRLRQGNETFRSGKGIGELFIIRAAGNIVALTQIARI